MRLELGFVKAVLTANYVPAGVTGFYVALEERFPARFHFSGVLSCFYAARAARHAHPVNSHAECVRTIKKDHQKHMRRKVSWRQRQLALA